MIFLKYLIFGAFISCVYFFLRRSIYFRPVTAVMVSPDKKVSTVSIKPNKRFFASYARPNGFVKIAYDLYAFYSTPSDPSESLKFGDFNFDSPILIFKLKRSRFVSVDFSDRVLKDVISKFIKEI